MGKQCFTCSNKQCRKRTKEEIQELRKVEGFYVSELEFKCAVSGKIIKQTDPSCEHYAGHELLEKVRTSLSDFAKRKLKELE